MRERTVLLLVVALVASTTGAGVAVNLLRPSDAQAWRAFDLGIDTADAPAVNTSFNLSVSVREAMLDPSTLWVVFLSLDVGTMRVVSATPASNPWGYPTVWNLTGYALTTTVTFNVTVIPSEAGSALLTAMVWVPRGEVRSAPVFPDGHVNPGGVDLESVAQLSVVVSAVA